MGGAASLRMKIKRRRMTAAARVADRSAFHDKP
jgi:hypothetical protein